ncbi:penicillin-binding protein 1C [Flavilitoribacter nigricans]|uniref:peptidoglycan glycosyltransferase n=1 Tax=Flavilitoribacter nigricans (strain ATCC 23147 / DSM 23189 / NBRC 102662 / NCIMB 1420 / SS-2) TaxID=1122177 RepID=A0A2D0N4D5_FLAN2|nr:penicillin-binding protein 1C [Flavilitoribacter nigricans]PHN03364.1 penicillin-binding protein 1C [Flavilitoribacter nigricans DSM 23189 = NBRC 102662]
MIRRLWKSIRKLFRTHPRWAWGSVLVLLLAYVFCLPRPLFDAPTSMVLEDREGNLLGARIAADGQWRFPAPDSLPQTFVQALLEFEDRRFYRHPGVDLRSIGRAMVQNIRNGRIVSGGSTITMQLMRMSRNRDSRSLWQKLIEVIQATRLEWTYSKEEILTLYAAHAPFGGNVVGLEAASWRYFAKRPELLTWAEAATLAVLPNSPGLIHPGRNRDALEAKRNRLLDRLEQAGTLDKLTCELAKEEPLPQAPLPLPRLAPHLLDRADLEYVKSGQVRQSRVRTTLDRGLQQQLNTLVQRHHERLRANGIFNLAAFVVDLESGAVQAYVGNVMGAGEDHGEAVDVITAPRSTGSILKPLLYASMLQEGQIVGETQVPDVPTLLSGYKPENFHEQYDGLVSARQALVRSLNVPFIHLLQGYGLEKFHYQLRKFGFQHITFPPDHYGLPLILGGAEASLWDITGTYASLGRILQHTYGYSGEYDPADFHKPYYLYREPTGNAPAVDLRRDPPFLGSGAIWLMLDAMKELERPNEEGIWERFRSSRQVAWKTGTSFGFRDAWAVGVTPQYAIGIWAGNADGEGRAGLVGVKAAAPVLFDIVNMLPKPPSGRASWFSQPYDDLLELEVCARSGFRPVEGCPVDTVWATANGRRVPPCPYHKTIHLDPGRQWRVNASCINPADIVHVPWLVLPPLEGHYYRSKHPDFSPLPPFRPDCRSTDEGQPMQLIYPKQPTRIYVPVDLDGSLSRTVFAVAHNDPGATIHWHIDEQFMGSTENFHSLELKPAPGPHLLTLVDERGNRLEQPFEIIGREE